MAEDLHFKISSALKNIIGRDLINDDFIAVFELVKNSYDAHATRVDVIFKNIYKKNPSIIIKDNGKGMDYNDLIEKWLFVAYSAKQNGTEEDSFDYRDKIKVKRTYAGAKGIGRFSCDRLGRNLYLETTKNSDNAKTESLTTDWDKFDGNLKDEFINVSVVHETIPNNNLAHGTLLEITDLRTTWDREKLLSLKKALAKLINPNTKHSEDSFKINIKAVEEEDVDQKIIIREGKKGMSPESIFKDVVNGDVENLIFETLDLKTTKIVSNVSSKEENIITTSLFEGGKLIYKIIEKNPLHDLHSVNFTIYYLNASSKSTFTRRMGVNPVEYGHIFMYKNGLRIFPYGERGEDPLKMDNRKAQGTNRYLGTREVIGYIDIKGENPALRETSSRGDGLLKTQAYTELYEWHYTTLRRFERYIVNVSDWGKDLSEDDYMNLDQHEKVIALQDLVNKLSKSKDLLSIEFAHDLFEILDSKQEGSARGILEDIKKKVSSDNFDKREVLANLKKAERKINSLEKITNEAQDETLIKLIENEDLTIDLEAEQKKGIFQGALIGTDKQRIISLQHQIFHSSSRINRNIKLLIQSLDPSFLNEKIQKHITVISLEALKINSIAKFITKANFNLQASEIETDLVQYFYGYIHEMYLSDDAPIDSKINKIDVIINGNIEHIIEFRPLEISTLIDNFIQNAENANSKKLHFVFSKINSELIIEIIDTGDGIDSKIINRIFDFGFTTTKGSGIGLHQIKDIVENLGGSISITSKIKDGSNFKIILR